MTLFVTHFAQVTQLADMYGGMTNIHLSAPVIAGAGAGTGAGGGGGGGAARLVSSHTLQHGSCDSSGMHPGT